MTSPSSQSRVLFMSYSLQFTDAENDAVSFKLEVIRLDIGLPQMDGYHVVRRPRQVPERAGIRIVALTDYGSQAMSVALARSASTTTYQTGGLHRLGAERWRQRWSRWRRAARGALSPCLPGLT